MKVVYYRDSDGVVVGSTSSPNSIDVAIELQAWGKGISALEVQDDSLRIGKIRKVENQQMIYVDDQDYLDKQDKKRSAWDEVQASTKLTEEKMILFFGRRP